MTLLLAPRGPVAAQQAPILIKELGVEGNRRVQEAVVLGRVQSKVGGQFNPSQLSEDLRNVFALGFFDDVQLKVEDFEGGVKITFVVIERPFVRDVDFTGNSRLSSTDLHDLIDLKLGSVYNPVDVQKAREKLQAKYEEEGYFEIQITPEVEKFADGDVKVVFSINEGRRITIDKIVIRGNKGLSDSQIKGAIATKERMWFVLRTTLQRQLLDQDVERILALYNDHGYIQVRVEKYDTTVDRERARVNITFNVVEGPQYRVGDIKFSGVTLVPEGEVRRLVKLKPGDVFSRSALRESIEEITNLYSTIGRASADVSPRTEPNPATSRVSLLFEITEGPEVYVERINISGNVRSQDKILRREIPMAEGDLFTLRKLQRAKQRLTNLGFFDKVDVTTAPGSDKTKIIVNVEVTERPTGLFSVGGGFSSADGLLGTIDLSQRNFLGRGWETSLRLRLGGKTQQGMVSFTEPWLFDRPLSAGFDLFNTRRIFTEYNLNSLGSTLRLSHPFEEFWRWHLGYRISRDRVSNLTDEASDALKREGGVRVTSAVSGSVGRDSRDNVVTPTRGGTITFGADVAGLGGDSQFIKTNASTTYFQPLWFGHVLSGRGEGSYGAGLGDEPLPLFERFYLGGPNSLRQFKFRRVSPVDDHGTRIGGTSEVLGNLEYLIPLPFNIRLAAFFDIGNVYGFGRTFDLGNLRKGAGGGFRWLSPFGPIRVDYGVNLDRRKGEDFGTVNFSVGSPF